MKLYEVVLTRMVIDEKHHGTYGPEEYLESFSKYQREETQSGHFSGLARAVMEEQRDRGLELSPGDRILVFEKEMGPCGSWIPRKEVDEASYWPEENQSDSYQEEEDWEWNGQERMS